MCHVPYRFYYLPEFQQKILIVAEKTGFICKDIGLTDMAHMVNIICPYFRKITE